MKTVFPHLAHSLSSLLLTNPGASKVVIVVSTKIGHFWSACLSVCLFFLVCCLYVYLAVLLLIFCLSHGLFACRLSTWRGLYSFFSAYLAVRLPVFSVCVSVIVALGQSCAGMCCWHCEDQMASGYTQRGQKG
jgi:hypothetical protein